MPREEYNYLNENSKIRFNQGPVFGLQDIPADYILGGVRLVATGYNITRDDFEQTLRVTAAGPVVVTILEKNIIGYAKPNTLITICQMGAGQITITGSGAVTLRAPGNKFKTAAQYSTIQARNISEDLWLLSGDLAL